MEILNRRKYTDAEINKLLKSIIILVDSREKINFHITDYYDKYKIQHEKLALPVGYYNFKWRMESMKIGEVVESLIQLKRDKDIYYPNDNAINLACNILERLPREKDVYEWIKENSK